MKAVRYTIVSHPFRTLTELCSNVSLRIRFIVVHCTHVDSLFSLKFPGPSEPLRRHRGAGLAAHARGRNRRYRNAARAVIYQCAVAAAMAWPRAPGVTTGLALVSCTRIRARTRRASEVNDTSLCTRIHAYTHFGRREENEKYA